MNQRRRERRPVLAVVALVLGVLGAACVQKDDPGVGINRVQASLVFGVKPVPVRMKRPPPRACDGVITMFGPGAAPVGPLSVKVVVATGVPVALVAIPAT